MNTKVSVVTPFYNSASYLAETIESVQAQTYDNWELILVNDGSTDNSVSIVTSYAKNDSRVVLVEYDKPGNKGKACARNLGIDNATGNYTTFLDSDDIFLPEKLSKKLEIFQKYSNINMVLANTIYWSNWKRGYEGAVDNYPDYLLDLNRIYKPGELISLMIGSKGAVPCICSFIVKTDALKKVGSFNDGFDNLYEDQALITKLILSSNIYLLDGYFEKYRQREDSDWHKSVSTGDDKKIAKTYRKWLFNTLADHPTDSKKLLAIFKSHQPSILNIIYNKLKKVI